MSSFSINPLTTSEMNKLRSVALGDAKADIVLANGNVVDVYSGRLLNNYSVAIEGDWIACAGKDISQTIGPNTRIIDLSGKVLIPGLVDGHAHMSYYGTPNEFLRYIMKGGTTTIITELVEISYVLGYLGITRFLNAVRNQPIKVFATAPMPFFLSKSAYKLFPRTHQLKRFLRRDDIVGLGESYWQMALNENTILPELAQETLELKKTVEGHSAGAHGDKLNAYIAYGISSCHESVNAEDVLERLELGLFVMIREGSIRKELDIISQIKDINIDFRRIGLVTDGIDPRELIKNGFLEYALQRAINFGFDPIKAIQMATINPAEHFHLESFIGGIAPGKHADIVVIPDLKNIKAEYVFSKGKLIARDGELLVEPRYYNFTEKGLKKLRKFVKASDFIIRTNGNSPVKVTVIDQVTDLVTREAVIDMTPVSGELKSDISRDILKVALITWEGKIFTGFIRGFKLKKGAIASSNAWDVFGIIVIGRDDADMAIAVNRLTRLHGGILVCEDGEIKAELSLPLGGILTTLHLETIVEKLDAIQQKAEDLGCSFIDMSRTMAVLTTAAIPFLRISEEGLIDVKNNKKVELLVK